MMTDKVKNGLLVALAVLAIGVSIAAGVAITNSFGLLEKPTGITSSSSQRQSSTAASSSQAPLSPEDYDIAKSYISYDDGTGSIRKKEMTTSVSSKGVVTSEVVFETPLTTTKHFTYGVSVYYIRGSTTIRSDDYGFRYSAPDLQFEAEDSRYLLIHKVIFSTDSKTVAPSPFHDYDCEISEQNGFSVTFFYELDEHIEIKAGNYKLYLLSTRTLDQMDPFEQPMLFRLTNDASKTFIGIKWGYDEELDKQAIFYIDEGGESKLAYDYMNGVGWISGYRYITVTSPLTIEVDNGFYLFWSSIAEMLS